MDENERYMREAKAKRGAVPPDLRRNSGARKVSDRGRGSEANVDQDTQRRLQGTQPDQ